MVEKGYNIVEIVDAVRRAGNPQKAALDALADTDGLTDAALLDALGVERWGDLPTTPYPDTAGQQRTRCPVRAVRPGGEAAQKAGPQTRRQAGEDSCRDAGRRDAENGAEAGERGAAGGSGHSAGGAGTNGEHAGRIFLRMERRPD